MRLGPALGVVAAFSFVLLGSGAAAAQSGGRGFYFELAPGGVAPLDTELDPGVDLEVETGFNATGAVGYRFDNGFRAEFEMSFRRNEFDKAASAGTAFGRTVAANQPLNGDQSFVVWMLNGYYDIATGTRWTPYLGAGLGGARVSLESGTLGVDDREAGFAYQGLAGVIYRISPHVWSELGYAYFATDTLAFAGTDAKFQAHVLKLGLQIGFDAF